MTKRSKFDSLGYYEVLNANVHSSDEEIRANYRELAKFWHPDHNKDENAINMFQKISLAYDILKEKKTRIRYNLLSLIYKEEDFPNMDSLCILRNIHGLEDYNMRAFHLIEVSGKILGHTKVDKMYFCNPQEAANVIKSITKHNWARGFLGISAFFVNIIAIINNIVNINNKKDNLLLLLHNAVTSEIDNKPQIAAFLAQEAKSYAEKDEIVLIDEFLKELNVTPAEKPKKWNFSKYKYMQLFYPLVAFSCIFVLCGVLYLKQIDVEKHNKLSVKEVVIMQDGKKVFNDFSVNRFFDIPVDVTDVSKLYHTTQNVNAMHGADREFDIMQKVERGTTVRLTGRTTDGKWFRVMFDNGEMGFIEAEYLAEGIGNEIPLWSKIYKEE